MSEGLWLQLWPVQGSHSAVKVAKIVPFERKAVKGVEL